MISVLTKNIHISFITISKKIKTKQNPSTEETDILYNEISLNQKKNKLPFLVQHTKNLEDTISVYLYI